MHWINEKVIQTVSREASREKTTSVAEGVDGAPILKWGRVKLSCLIKYHAMKVYGRVEVYLRQSYLWH